MTFQILQKKFFVLRDYGLAAALVLPILLGHFLPGAEAQVREDHPLSIKLNLNSLDDDLRIGALREHLARSELDQHQRYEAIHLLNDYLILKGTVGETEIVENCKKWPARSEDLWARVTCVIADRSLDEAVQSEKIFQFFEMAMEQDKDRTLAAHIAHRTAKILANQNDFARSTDMLKRALETIDASHEQLAADLKTNIAYIYSSPNNRIEVIKESLQILDEIEPFYLKKNTRESLKRASINSFNKGIVYLFSFRNYGKAVEEFRKVSLESDTSLKPDTHIFHSFALARLGRKDEALAEFKKINFDEQTLLHRSDFLLCFLTLTRHAIGLDHDFRVCTKLPENTQSDAILNITAELSQLDISDEIKVQIWQQFWNFYRSKIEPEFQNVVQKSIDSVELQRVKLDATTKDLQLKNLQIYRYVSLFFVILACTMLASFAFAVISLKKLNRKNRTISIQSQHIVENNLRLRGILDSMQEALFQLDAELNILPGRSAFAASFFSEQTQSFTEVIQLMDETPDSKARILATLRAIIGEASISWELNRANLPSDLSCSNRIFDFHWQPVFQEGLCLIMTVTLRDVTDLRASQKRLEQSQAQALNRTIMLEQLFLTSDHQQTLQFFENLQQQIRTIPMLLESSMDHKAILRQVHTIKGTARSLGLGPIKDAAHLLESAYSAADPKQLQVSIDNIIHLAYEYGALSRLFSLQDRPYCLGDYVWQVVPSLYSRFTDAGLPPLQCKVEDGLGYLQPYEALVYEIVLHGLTNACDHGFLQHRAGAKYASLDKTLITVRGERNQDGWIVDILDNGWGLDWAGIDELCRVHQFTPKAGRPKSDVLLVDTVSTTRLVNDVSGRGVGLAVVADHLARLGGHATLLDNSDGRGTILRCYWPQALAQVS